MKFGRKVVEVSIDGLVARSVGNFDSILKLIMTVYLYIMSFEKVIEKKSSLWVTCDDL